VQSQHTSSDVQSLLRETRHTSHDVRQVPLTKMITTIDENNTQLESAKIAALNVYKENSNFQHRLDGGDRQFSTFNKTLNTE
jgi:hypothetical protein